MSEAKKAKTLPPASGAGEAEPASDAGSGAGGVQSADSDTTGAVSTAIDMRTADNETPQAAGDSAAAGMDTDDGENSGAAAAAGAADDEPPVQRFPFASLPEAVHDRIAAVSPTSGLPALLHARC